jgi:selenide,water dikinase
MAENSQVTFELDLNNIPFIPETIEYAQMGLVPGGAYNNRNYFKDKINCENIKEEYLDLLFDPQTSGGLLISVNEKYADDIILDLQKNLKTQFSVIGKVLKYNDKYIKFKN